MGSDGRVTCSNVEPAYAHSGASSGQKAECRLNSDGSKTCGYNCRMGSRGRFACARTPDGVCSMGADGRVYCSN
jgi:hypothetical protein